MGISVLMLSLASCSSEMDAISTDIPPAVTEALMAKYPDAKDVKWEIEKKDGDHVVYEADFESDGKNREAHFNADGTQIDD